MSILHKLVDAVANRLSLGPRKNRALVDTVLRQLPEASYWRLKEQGFEPGAVIDIGAHRGDWTRLIRSVFPAPPILMIEARVEQQKILQKTSNELSDVSCLIALLGRQTNDSAQFHVGGTGS